MSELRYLETSVKVSKDTAKIDKKLQYRTVEHEYYGEDNSINYIWSEWQDVPTVSE